MPDLVVNKFNTISMTCQPVNDDGFCFPIICIAKNFQGWSSEPPPLSSTWPHLKIILTSLYLVGAWSGEIFPLPGGLTNCCPSVLDTVGWVI